MDTFYYDWFEIVEEQSDRDTVRMALQDLDFCAFVSDPNGFMVVNTKKMPAELKPFLNYDTVEPMSPFRYRNKVLLKNDKLSKYLALAKAFKVHRFNDVDYVEVLFERKEETKPSIVKEPLNLNNIDGVLVSAPLHSCWELFCTGENKELVAQILLERERKALERSLEKPSSKDEIVTIKMFQGLLDSFVISALTAVLNAWVKRFDKAKEIMDNTGIAAMRHPPMALIVRHYLELLMINKQEEILATFFANEMLRKGYLTHYEIYMQNFVDPGFVCTRTQQATIVRDRIEDFKEMYL